MKPTPMTSEEQKAALGNVRRKPQFVDMFTGDASAKLPKRGSGAHVRLHDASAKPVGMAFFPGTGPADTYCERCVSCQDIKVHRGRVLSPTNTPADGRTDLLLVQRAACLRAAEMQGGIVQRGGIGANRSCKYFEPKP